MPAENFGMCLHPMRLGSKNGRLCVTHRGTTYLVESNRPVTVQDLGMHIEVCILGHDNGLPGEKTTDPKGRPITICRVKNPIAAAY
jgi:hypothetical protein